MSIPKIIHYCWLSNDEKPEKIQKCLDSWSAVMPDYEIRHWGIDSFDFDSIPFLKEAVAQRKWAFAADFIRLYAVYSCGGIYLDSDVMVLKSFDDFLDHKMFIGTEKAEDTSYYPEAAIFGAEKGMEVLNEIMDYYRSLRDAISDSEMVRIKRTEASEWSVYNSKGEYHLAIAPIVFTHFLKFYGYKNINEAQNLDNNLVVYPIPIFVNSTCRPTNETYAIHLNTSAWVKLAYLPSTGRGLMFKFCKRFDLDNLYHIWGSVAGRAYRVIKPLIKR